MRKEKAGGPVWGEVKRALGKTSRDRPAERWPERDEEDLERCTEEEEDEEEERARDLKEKRVRNIQYSIPDPNSLVFKKG